MAVRAQVNTVLPVLLVIAAVGAVISCVVMMVSVSVQPLAAVTVTVYVAGLVADAVALLPSPPDQPKLTPPPASKLIAVRAQVNTVLPVLLVIAAEGAVIS